MSHYSDMGFSIKRLEDIQILIDNLYHRGISIPSSNGSYTVITVDENIEFWVQLRGSKFVGLEFHYGSSNNIKVKFVSYIKDEEASKLGGAIHVWYGDEFPMILDVPNLDSYKDLKEDDLIDVQVAAFADSLDIYDNKEEFDLSQKEEVKFAHESFIAKGMFQNDENAPYQAYAAFSGTINSFKKCTNSYSRREYYHFEVSCLGVVFDVLADPKFILKEPRIGGILKGEFWMSGKIL